MDPNAILDEISAVGRDPSTGGYSRHLFNSAELELREWFTDRATGLGLHVETDGNANIWAWWGEPGANAVVTGSHLDSVPGGGAFDGPLGIASAFAAVERLQQSRHQRSRPFAIVMFAEEEGSRFGIACLGSGLLTGAIDPSRVLKLTDSDGQDFATAAKRVGFDIRAMGRDQQRLDRIGLFIELHIEQGRGLAELGQPIAIATSILAHGRWTLTFLGEGNHAGTTPMNQRHDPMVAAARAVLEIQSAAITHVGSRATVGRILATPGAANAIASAVTLSLDARASLDADVRTLVADIAARIDADGFVENSWSPSVAFDERLISRLRDVLVDAPTLATGAGHDAGVLAGFLPTAMLFVRNPTGISHAPNEYADPEDCRAGAEALENVLRRLL